VKFHRLAWPFYTKALLKMNKSRQLEAKVILAGFVVDTISSGVED
jgi:hypothetical protein